MKLESFLFLVVGSVALVVLGRNVGNRIDLGKAERLAVSLKKNAIGDVKYFDLEKRCAKKFPDGSFFYDCKIWRDQFGTDRLRVNQYNAQEESHPVRFVEIPLNDY